MHKNTNFQAGFSLLEVLVAFLILDIVLLAFYQTKLTALRHVQNAYFMSFAEFNNTAMAEQLRACRVSATCIEHEKQSWLQKTPSLFPQGQSFFSQSSNNYLLETRWYDLGLRSVLTRYLKVYL